MSVLLVSVLGICTALTAFRVPAVAEQDMPEPEVRCALDDPRLDEVSGLAVDGDRWYAVNDGGTRLEVYVLDQQCRVREVIENPTEPYDVEDMSLGQDGTLWLSDTGDNWRGRDTAALHAVEPDGQSTLYRLTYPDGPHDVETLLLDESDTPYLLTKNVLGESGVYRPSESLSSPGPTPLEKVDTVSVTMTDTPGGPVGALGSLLVTGGAATPDRTVFAIRTYTDVYLYPAPEGDVPTALQREPVRVPLPDERQGEAIAFTDEETLLSASEGVGTPIRAIPDAAGLVPNVSESSDKKTTSTTESPALDESGEENETVGNALSDVWVISGIAVVVGLVGGTLWILHRKRR